MSRYRSDMSVQSRSGTEEGVRFYFCYLEIIGLDSPWGLVAMPPINGREMPEDSPENPFVAIIGQDVLAHLVFTHDGPNRSFSLATSIL